MHVLLIYCHPCSDSLSATLCEVATEALRSAGHEVEVRQLYAEKFDPVLGAEERRRYYDESFQRDTTAEHIASLQRAEAMVFVYPTWWFGPPAMLKGWFDRVCGCPAWHFALAAQPCCNRY
jgi:NAD(P)H dehydrogenase (quinone)